MNSYLFLYKQICFPYYKSRVCFQKFTSTTENKYPTKEDYSWLFVGYILQSYTRTQYKPQQFINIKR